MILGIRLYKEDNQIAASIVPIAFPLIAGAGTMTNYFITSELLMIKSTLLLRFLINVVVVYGFKIFWENQKNWKQWF